MQRRGRASGQRPPTAVPPRRPALQALAAFAAALAAEPAHLPALLGCASVYKDSGLLEDSLAMLERAQAAAQAAAAAAAAGAGAGAGGAPAGAEEVPRALAMVLTDLGGWGGRAGGWAGVRAG